jgi:hypothetical protein
LKPALACLTDILEGRFKDETKEAAQASAKAPDEEEHRQTRTEEGSSAANRT